MRILLTNATETAAVLLFAIGFMILLLHPHMIKKIIGMNLMETAIFLYFTSIGYVEEGVAPLFVEGSPVYVNPLPTALMLTGIVVSVSMTALMLALAVRLYEAYGTLDLTWTGGDET